MAIEKFWEPVGTTLFTANGGKDGEISVALALGFHVKQPIQIKSNTQTTLHLIVKAVTPTQIIVGVPNTPLESNFTDLSTYLVADGASISMPKKQPRPKIAQVEHERAVFAEEPIVAKRTINVDSFGRYYSTGNPIPTQLDDQQTGAPAFVSPSGSLNTAEIVRLVGGNFVSGQPLLSHIWTTTLANGGTTSTADGELIMSTNTTANGSVFVESFRKSRFITATFNLSHQAISTPNRNNTDVIRRWGCFNPAQVTQDGIFFENDSGQINIVRMKNNVRVEVVPEADFNGKNPFIFNDEVSIYEIIYNAGTIFFTQNRKLIHKMTSLDAAAYGTPHLKVGHSIENINGNTTNNTMVTRGSSISRIGANTALPDYFRINTASTNIIKNGPGRLHKIVVSNKGIGAASVTMYNNFEASGELIDNIDTFDISGVFEYNVEFDIGLTVVTSGGQISIVAIYD